MYSFSGSMSVLCMACPKGMNEFMWVHRVLIQSFGLGMTMESDGELSKA